MRSDKQLVRTLHWNIGKLRANILDIDNTVDVSFADNAYNINDRALLYPIRLKLLSILMEMRNVPIIRKKV